MDDVFQILIYLLIIISFIAPIFRKKNKDKSSLQSPRQRFPLQDGSKEISEVKIKAAESKQPDYDVLKELENFFKVGPEEKTQNSINQNLKYEGFRQEPVPEIFPQTPNYQSTWEKKKTEVESVVRSLDKKIESQAKQFQDEMAYMEKPTSNKLASQIKMNIRKPEKLKEYILMAEIIGKPKSLRR